MLKKGGDVRYQVLDEQRTLEASAMTFSTYPMVKSATSPP